MQTALSFQPGSNGLSRAHPGDADAATAASKTPSAPRDQPRNVLCIPFPHPFILHSAPPPFSLSLYAARAPVTCTQAGAEHPRVLLHPRAPPSRSLCTRSPTHRAFCLPRTTNCTSGAAETHRASPPPRPAVTPVTGRGWWAPFRQGLGTSGSPPQARTASVGAARPAGRAEHLPMPKAKPAPGLPPLHPTPAPLSKHPSRNPPSGRILFHLLQAGARAPTSITCKGS